MNEILLETVGLQKFYSARGREPIRALDGVDVTVRAGCSVGIAGESGSGKSSLLRLLLGLDTPTGGSVDYHGSPIADLKGDALRAYRAAVQPVLQDTTNCFNPRMRILDAIVEPATNLRGTKGEARTELAERLLQVVGLTGDHLSRFPHQLSGGQRQRVAIARALSTAPEILLLDEPVTALDVSIRGNILNLFRDRATQDGLTYVVVSHDLLSIYYLTDYLYVMRHGCVVEEGPTVEVIGAPQHPYTQLLVTSVADPLYDPAA